MALAYGLLEPVDLSLPHLPRALEGLRIAHLSDLHVRHSPAWYSRLEAQLTSQRFDLVVFTGDYMNLPGKKEEKRTVEVIRQFCHGLRPRYGTFGVFGNHDTALLREQCQGVAVRWLRNDVHRVPDRPLEVLGLDMLNSESPDSVTLAMRCAQLNESPSTERTTEPTEKPLRLMLAHTPSSLPVAADFGVDLLLCGHTHGGQCRLPTGHALINSSDLPLHLTSGILRHRNTLATVSRGIGFIGLVPRVFCKPHVPVYTLRRGALPGAYSETIRNLRPW